MSMFQLAGCAVGFGLSLGLWAAVQRAKQSGATWIDKAVAWYLAFATVWVLIVAVKGVR